MALASALNHTVQSTCAPGLMEIETEVLRMPIGIDAGKTLRALADWGEENIAHLRQRGGCKAKTNSANEQPNAGKRGYPGSPRRSH